MKEQVLQKVTEIAERVGAREGIEIVRKADEARTIELNHGRVVFDSAETPPTETRYTPLLGQPAIGGPSEGNWPAPPRDPG